MSNVTDIINDTVDPARGVAAEPVSTEPDVAAPPEADLCSSCGFPRNEGGHALCDVRLVLPEPKPKAKAPSRWRGQTWVYLNKAGERYAIYHRNSAGTQSWEHGYDADSRVGCAACVVV